MFKKIKWQVAGLLCAVIPLVAFSGGPNPERIYSALDVGEWRVIFRDPDTGAPRVGTTVLEKAVGGLLCRKISAVVPNPVPRYQCFVQLTLSGEQAMALFQLLNTRVLDVAYLEPASSSPRLGVNVMEKTTDDLICQSISPVVPEPVAKYTCYTDIGESTLLRKKRHVERDERDRH